MSNIPKDPYLLYSFINMKLRDEYDSLDDFCVANDVQKEEILNTLEAAGFSYSEETNQLN